RHRPPDARRLHDDDPVQGPQDQVPGQEMRRLALLTLLIAGCGGPEAAPAPQAAPAPAAKEDEGKSLFDGKTLTGWKSVEFGGEGAVKVENGEIRLAEGATLNSTDFQPVR